MATKNVLNKNKKLWKKNKLMCSVTGKETYIGAHRKTALVEKYGDEKTLFATYMSREGKSKLKGKAVSKKKTEQKAEKAKRAPGSTKSTNKLTCNHTGKQVYMNKERMEKLVAAVGTRERLENIFVCREARKELNLDKYFRRKPEKRKRERKTDDEGDHIYMRVDPRDNVKKWFWLHREYEVKSEALALYPRDLNKRKEYVDLVLNGFSPEN